MYVAHCMNDSIAMRNNLTNISAPVFAAAFTQCITHCSV